MPLISPSQIQPFQMRKIGGKLLLKGPEGGHQIIGVLLAEGVKMQTLHLIRQLLRQLLPADSQT